MEFRANRNEYIIWLEPGADKEATIGVGVGFDAVHRSVSRA